MDTTEKYIKMVDCPEIQGEWKPKEIDAVIIRRLKDESNDLCLPSGIQYLREKQPDPYTGWHIHGEHIHYMIGRFLWLPRQDQLQEMVIKEDERSCIALIGASHLMAERLNHYIFDSFEQLWLAFVMKEKYGKIWDDKKQEWAKNKSPTNP